jgi:hypothetical protein
MFNQIKLNIPKGRSKGSTSCLATYDNIAISACKEDEQINLNQNANAPKMPLAK